MKITIKVAKDFSDAPGGRYRKDGEFSGEAFREDVLVPKYDALTNDDVLIVDLDGGYGYGISFLEEVFGGMARKYGVKPIQEKIQIISNDEPDLVNKIANYIKNARQ